MSAAHWAGRLRLAYRRDDLGAVARTVVHDRHDGPLRVLASLYPEDPVVCHSVLVHPPGGLVGGDALAVEIEVGAGAHALVTTPGATRYYRSTGAPAVQRVSAMLGEGARLEWLPLETLAFSGCLGESALHLTLAPGAEAIGWDVLALGLPAAGKPFERGSFVQTIEWPGHWREHARIDAGDTRLLDSPLGWAGHRVLATLWFAAGTPLAAARREALLEAARGTLKANPLAATAGATAPGDSLIVLRVLAPRVEPAMRLLSAVWAAWRMVAWQRAACIPRVWRT